MAKWLNLIKPPTLDLRKKHTIEVVIDRIKVREDMRLRLAESFETALALADGIAAVGFMDEPRKRRAFFHQNLLVLIAVIVCRNYRRVYFHLIVQWCLCCL